MSHVASRCVLTCWRLCGAQQWDMIRQRLVEIIVQSFCSRRALRTTRRPTSHTRWGPRRRHERRWRHASSTASPRALRWASNWWHPVRSDITVTIYINMSTVVSCHVIFLLQTIIYYTSCQHLKTYLFFNNTVMIVHYKCYRSANDSNLFWHMRAT